MAKDQVHALRFGKDYVLFIDKVDRGERNVLDKADEVILIKEGKKEKSMRMSADAFVKENPGALYMGQSYDHIRKIFPAVYLRKEDVRKLLRMKPIRAKPLSFRLAVRRESVVRANVEHEFKEMRKHVRDFPSVVGTYALPLDDSPVKEAFAAKGYRFINVPATASRGGGYLLAIPPGEVAKCYRAIDAIKESADRKAALSLFGKLFHS